MIGEATVLLAATAAPRDDPAQRLGVLFDTHHDRLYRLARRLCRTRDDARDLLANSTIARAQQPATKGPVRKAASPAVQGFNVVLVLGDLEGVASDGSGNVPTAGRKALADMKDFLPYKSRESR